jgi:putative ABC transport system permease protein
MGSLLQDLRYAARTLRQSPGFTAVAALTLALGIGANTTVYTTVRAFLLDPFPALPDPERLVRIVEVPPQRDSWAAEVSPGTLAAFRRGSRTLTEIAASRWWTASVGDPAPGGSGRAEPEAVTGFRTTANYFRALGVRPLLGRGFLPGEDRPGHDAVAVLSHSLWKRRFAADPRVLGRPILLNGRQHLVVGVLPPDVTYPEGGEVWAPLSQDLVDETNFLGRSLQVFGRLAPGLEAEAARAELAAISRRVAAEHPDHGGWGLLVQPIEQFQARFARPFALAMTVAVGLVLLIVCANIANLLLARGTVRRREFAVRTALGAGRLRLVRQRLTESLLLAGLGGGLGVLAAAWGVALFRAAMPAEVTDFIPAWNYIQVDRGALAFTALAALASGVLAGLAPALQRADARLGETLKDGGRGASAALTRRGGLLRGGLVAGEIALALVLAVSTGLVSQSFARMMGQDYGFSPDRLLTMRISLPADPYDTPAELRSFAAALTARVRALPGVEAAGTTNVLPLTGGDWNEPIWFPGRPEPKTGDLPWAGYRIVSAGWFRAAGTPVVRGRELGAADREGAPPVAVVNQSLARLHFPGADPVGRQIQIADEEPRTIVGVVRDVRTRGLNEPVQPEVFVPHLQEPARSFSLAVRAAGDPAALAKPVQRELAALDPTLAAADLQPFARVIARHVSPSQITAGMLAIFAAMALAIAAIGIYGVISFAVAQRTHEIGVRVALGAARRDVLALVVGQGARLALLGVALGLAGALAMGKALAGILYAVSPTDPPTFAAAAVLLAGVALAASYLPARRAADTDPVRALKGE